MCFLPQQLDNIHVTVLHKEEGAGLGFSLAGGADLENKVITVSGPGRGGGLGGQRGRQRPQLGEDTCQEGPHSGAPTSEWLAPGRVLEGSCGDPTLYKEPSDVPYGTAHSTLTAILQ